MNIPGHSTRGPVWRPLAAVLFLALCAGNGVDAYAAESGHSGGHTGGPPTARGHVGGRGGHDDGHDTTTHDSDHGSKGRHGGGRGGAVSGRGGGIHGGGHDSGRRVESIIFRGGRPVWAREGIPEVELGRLNMGRAPRFVLDRALDEAASRFDPATMAAFYSLDAEAAAGLLERDYANVARLDSPQQNLALYRDVMMDFPQPLLPGIRPVSQLDLAAIYLGSAADKGIPVTEESVIAINRILGLVPLDDGARATLAAKADGVRIGLATGHGPEGAH